MGGPKILYEIYFVLTAIEVVQQEPQFGLYQHFLQVDSGVLVGSSLI